MRQSFGRRLRPGMHLIRALEDQGRVMVSAVSHAPIVSLRQNERRELERIWYRRSVMDSVMKCQL